MSRRSSDPLLDLLDACVALLVSTVLMATCLRVLAPFWPLLLVLGLFVLLLAVLTWLLLNRWRRRKGDRRSSSAAPAFRHLFAIILRAAKKES